MSRPVRFHPEARAELRDAVSFYHEGRSGLGAELVAVVRRTVMRIQALPEAGTAAEEGTRRTLLPRFPFALVYLVEPDRIWIVALMHHRREPGYWRERL